MTTHARSTLFAALSLGTLLYGGCIGGLGPNPVDAPEPNPAITLADAPVLDTTVTTIECDGPADELAMLGDLCGMDPAFAGATGVNGGWGRNTTYGVLDLFVMGDPADFTTLEFAGFVELASGEREPLGEGQVHVTMATNQACSNSFSATASFLWRGTTIRVPWSATVPC